MAQQSKAQARAPKRSLVIGAAAAVAIAAVYLLYVRVAPPPLRKLNIVLVTADTLRADRLPTYGYDRVATPHIDALAANGVVFDNAQTVVPLTLPAHSSMFTGTYPMYHGVRDNGGYYLDDAHDTLAESLQAAGYATGGFVSAFVLDGRWGLTQGFDRYFDDFDFRKYDRIALDTVQRPGGEVVDEALSWMDSVKDGPFFAWLHFYDVHTPYDPPEPFASQYGGYPGARYDGEIAYLDSLMGRLDQWLSEGGLDDDTIVVFIGDHGESLGQHDEITHGFFIYDATMKVPFILKVPYRHFPRGRRVEGQVRSIDLMPTLLELVGLEAPEPVQGVSLVPLVAGELDDLGLYAYSESLYPRNHYGWSELKSIRTSEYHFIDAPRPELFDVENDPGQRTNLVDQRAATVRRLKEELDRVVDELSLEGVDERGPATLDAETQQQLAALGYLGAPSRVSIDPDRPLADPKDKIELFNLIKRAGSESSEGRLEDAMRTIDRILDEDTNILEAHNIRGNLFAKMEDHEEAIRAYQEALARDAEYKPALFGLAVTYQQLGRVADAEAGYRRILELDPRDNRATFSLARIHADRSQFDEAIAILGRAVDVGGEQAGLHNLMAECYIGLDELERAEASVRRALEINSEFPTAYYNLALIFEERGDFQAAIDAYIKEVEVAPKDYKAHFNLAKLYQASRRPQLAKRHFELAIEHNTEFAIGHFFLAKIHLDSGNLELAEELAVKGVDLGAEPSMAPLGHFLLADIYNRQGRVEEAERQLEIGRRLQGY